MKNQINPQKKSKKKFLLKFVLALSLVLITLGAIGMIIYPNYNDIVLIKKDFDITSISKAVSINFFRSVSPKISLSEYEDDLLNETSLEAISEEQLKRISNESAIANRLEPKGTKVTIESINVDAYVLDGTDAHRMDFGPWHFPLSDYPGEKGNVVIIGHRFAELPPSQNTFFNLDKIIPGDKIVISQNGGIEYVYTVIETKVVEKSDRTVLLDYGDYRITLITCTPLWTAKQRLVITGILDRAYISI